MELVFPIVVAIIGAIAHRYFAPTQEETNPTPSFRWETKGLLVSFIAKDLDDAIKWEWDFGNGKSYTGPNPSHTYEHPANNLVTLTVTFRNGEVKSATKTVITRE